MHDSGATNLKNLANVKRIQIFTWDTQSMIVQTVVRMCQRASVGLVELVPLHGNTNATQSVLAVSESSICDTYLKVENDESIYRPDECEFHSENTESIVQQPEYRIVVSGEVRKIKSPTGMTFLDKQWDWPELFSNITDAFGMSLERSSDDLLVPKEYLIDSLRDSMGISDGMDAEIMLDEVIRVGLLEEVEYELYRLRYHDPKMYSCLNWSGRSLIDGCDDYPIDQLIPHVVALTNRTPSINSRVYLDLLNYLDVFRVIQWTSFVQRNDPKLLLDLHYVLMRQISWAEESYENKRREKFYFEFHGGQRVYPGTIRSAICACVPREENVRLVSLEILCELRWTLLGVPDLDEGIMDLARRRFCTMTTKEYDGILYVPGILKPVLQLAPFSDFLRAKLSTAKKVSFYDLVISVF